MKRFHLLRHTAATSSWRRLGRSFLLRLMSHSCGGAMAALIRKITGLWSFHPIASKLILRRQEKRERERKKKKNWPGGTVSIFCKFDEPSTCERWLLNFNNSPNSLLASASFWIDSRLMRPEIERPRQMTRLANGSFPIHGHVQVTWRPIGQWK